MKMLWTARTNNIKTGDIPTAWIGTSKEESKKTCEGCPQLGTGNGDTKCYAWGGMVAVGLKAVQDGFKRGLDYSLSNALRRRNKNAKAVRIGSIGDPGAVRLREYLSSVRSIRRQNLSVLSYTHRWRKLKASQWKKNIMASCDTIKQVDEAIALGWRATVVLPWDFKGKRLVTPGGNTVIVCPAIYTKSIGLSDDKIVTCNSCRLCDASRSGPSIGFPDHGPAVRSKKKKLPIL